MAHTFTLPLNILNAGLFLVSKRYTSQGGVHKRIRQKTHEQIFWIGMTPNSMFDLKISQIFGINGYHIECASLCRKNVYIVCQL